MIDELRTDAKRLSVREWDSMSSKKMNAERRAATKGRKKRYDS